MKAYKLFAETYSFSNFDIYYKLLLLLFTIITPVLHRNNGLCQICYRNVISLLNIFSEDAPGTLIHLRWKSLWLNIWNPLSFSQRPSFNMSRILDLPLIFMGEHNTMIIYFFNNNSAWNSKSKLLEVKWKNLKVCYCIKST